VPDDSMLFPSISACVSGFGQPGVPAHSVSPLKATTASRCVAALEASRGWAPDIAQNIPDKSRMLRSFFSHLESDVLAAVAAMLPYLQVQLAFSCALTWSTAA
jgi:hypothetical protein